MKPGPRRSSPPSPAPVCPCASTTPPPATLRRLTPGRRRAMYVCGITPYDATHMGHAATYVTFDLLGRALRDAGHEVLYVQNVTDVDDPLLERAAARRRGLAGPRRRRDRPVPRGHDRAGGDRRPTTTSASSRRSTRSPRPSASCWQGLGYRVELPAGEGDPGAATSTSTCRPSPASARCRRWTREQMLDGVRRARRRPRPRGQARPARPAAVAGAPRRASRPGTAASSARAARAGTSSAPRSRWTTSGMRFDVQGGGTDLVFPHHEMSAVQATGADRRVRRSPGRTCTRRWSAWTARR